MRARALTTGILLLLTTAAAVPVGAQSTEAAASDSARIVDRVIPSEADLMIVTRSGDAALALVGDDLLLQLTDHGLELLGEEGAEEGDEADEDRSLMSEILGAMARAGMRRLLDHGMAYPIDGIRYAEWEDDRLLLETMDGDELFDITVNDRHVMADFRPSDARRLVRAIRDYQDRQSRGR